MSKKKTKKEKYFNKNNLETRNNELKCSIVANNLKNSIKNGRKIFKLMNFLLEFKRI